MRLGHHPARPTPAVSCERVENSVTEEERERYEAVPPLRTCEEVAYYRIFAKALGGVRSRDTIGRFAAVRTATHRALATR